MRTVPYSMWVEYFLLVLARQEAEPKSLLDVCCGTGIVAEKLTRMGYRVSGYDISEPMIREARRKAEEKKLNIRYEVMDAAEADMGETFDAAYSFFDSLNYITDPCHLRKAIARVGAQLRTGASFVFDLNTPYAFEQKMFDQRQMHPAAKMRYEWKGDWDPETRLIHVTMKFWRKGEEFEELHVQRAYADEEIRDMLGEAGFERIVCYHAYSLERPRKNSDRVHYAAMKR